MPGLGGAAHVSTSVWLLVAVVVVVLLLLLLPSRITAAQMDRGDEEGSPEATATATYRLVAGPQSTAWAELEGRNDCNLTHVWLISPVERRLDSAEHAAACLAVEAELSASSQSSVTRLRHAGLHVGRRLTRTELTTAQWQHRGLITFAGLHVLLDHGLADLGASARLFFLADRLGASNVIAMLLPDRDAGLRLKLYPVNLANRTRQSPDLESRQYEASLIAAQHVLCAWPVCPKQADDPLDRFAGLLQVVTASPTSSTSSFGQLDLRPASAALRASLAASARPPRRRLVCRTAAVGAAALGPAGLSTDLALELADWEGWRLPAGFVRQFDQLALRTTLHRTSVVLLALLSSLLAGLAGLLSVRLRRQRQRQRRRQRRRRRQIDPTADGVVPPSGPPDEHLPSLPYLRPTMGRRTTADGLVSSCLNVFKWRRSRPDPPERLAKSASTVAMTTALVPPLRPQSVKLFKVQPDGLLTARLAGFQAFQPGPSHPVHLPRPLFRHFPTPIRHPQPPSATSPIEAVYAEAVRQASGRPVVHAQFGGRPRGLIVSSPSSSSSLGDQSTRLLGPLGHFNKPSTLALTSSIDEQLTRFAGPVGLFDKSSKMASTSSVSEQLTYLNGPAGRIDKPSTLATTSIDAQLTHFASQAGRPNMPPKLALTSSFNEQLTHFASPAERLNKPSTLALTSSFNEQLTHLAGPAERFHKPSTLAMASSIDEQLTRLASQAGLFEKASKMAQTSSIDEQLTRFASSIGRFEKPSTLMPDPATNCDLPRMCVGGGFKANGEDWSSKNLTEARYSLGPSAVGEESRNKALPSNPVLPQGGVRKMRTTSGVRFADQKRSHSACYPAETPRLGCLEA